jgi:hypothetical protein
VVEKSVGGAASAGTRTGLDTNRRLRGYLVSEHLYSYGMSSDSDIPTEPEALGEEIARTAAHLDAATHRLLTCIRAF